MRVTIQYSMILDAVRRLHCHATAEDVYEYVAKENPHISRGTVYRNLNRLSEMGEIARRKFPDGADVFDHRCDKHYHARCEKCGRIFDVDMDYLEHLDAQIQNKHGFIYTDNDILFKCICPDCQH